MKTYRDVLRLLKNMPEDQLDEIMVICDHDDNYRGFDGYWNATGDELGLGRRPAKGRLVLVVEECLEGED